MQDIRNLDGQLKKLMPKYEGTLKSIIADYQQSDLLDKGLDLKMVALMVTFVDIELLAMSAWVKMQEIIVQIAERPNERRRLGKLLMHWYQFRDYILNYLVETFEHLLKKSGHHESDHMINILRNFQAKLIS